MSTGENVLWIVQAEHVDIISKDKAYIFRTREAANKFKKDRQPHSKVYIYRVRRATWGPEQ